MNPPGAARATRVQAAREHLARLSRVLVAFSGGVDSSVLLALARQELGAGALAAIADSPSLARSELECARRTAQHLGAELLVLATDELADPDYVANSGSRCYYCKRTLFECMQKAARELGIEHLAFGEIVDDLGEVRPGARAAREYSVHAPLREAGLTKLDVRALAREWGLEVADKPSSPCLASRLPMGTRVTTERLARVERAEGALKERGFSVLRVRDLGQSARVELGAGDFERGLLLAEEVGRRLARAGFEHHELARYAAPKA